MWVQSEQLIKHVDFHLTF